MFSLLIADAEMLEVKTTQDGIETVVMLPLHEAVKVANRLETEGFPEGTTITFNAGDTEVMPLICTETAEVVGFSE